MRARVRRALPLARRATLGFWDNRATQHSVVGDFGDRARVIQRVTLRGDRAPTLITATRPARMGAWTMRVTGCEGPGSRLLGDVAVLVVFVLVGRRSHHEDAGIAGFFRVWWPFAAGLLVAWLATGLWRAPLSWSRAVLAWLLTVALGMVLRIVVQGRDFKVAFTIVTLLFVGAGMLGWRGVARWRRSRIHTATPVVAHAAQRHDEAPGTPGRSLGGCVQGGRTGRRFGDGTGTLPHHVPRPAMRGKPRGRDFSQAVGTRPDRATARGSPVS